MINNVSHRSDVTRHASPGRTVILFPITLVMKMMMMMKCSAFRNIGQNDTYSLPWPFDKPCFFSFAFKIFYIKKLPIKTLCPADLLCVLLRMRRDEIRHQGRASLKRRDFLIEARETRSNDTWQRAKMFQPYLKGPLCQSTLNKSARLSWKSDFCSIGKTKYATERV